MRGKQRPNITNKILINQGGTKININLSTNNVFERGAFCSALGRSIESSLDHDHQHESLVWHPARGRHLPEALERSADSGAGFDSRFVDLSESRDSQPMISRHGERT